ncbi:MAG: PD40 domain-containing protein [Acidobacteria bacterium]|nr:PD40 domain-containing protein [Acidobacteriota bacterium]
MLGLSTLPSEVTAQSPCCRITTEKSTNNSNNAIEDTPTAKDTKWQVEGDHGPSTTVEFDTDEGTWMNLDVSRDGSQVVFDLLGDIYVIPITGGQAKLLSGGSAWDMQPRFSPDGKQIAFISDRGGGDNIWLMNADGSNRRILTKESFRLLSSPYWSPDGDWIIARKHFTNTRSLGAGEVWMYNVRGGSGVQVTQKTTDTSDVNEPAFSPDGRWVYYSYSGPFDYNKDPNGGIFQISRYDRFNGRTEPVTTQGGGGIRPTPSPDGRFLAYIRRVRLKTVLYVRDLETGVEKALFDGLDKDQQETWAIHGVFPAFAWTPDSKKIVITATGKLWSINATSTERTAIPFTAHVKQTITNALRFPQKLGESNISAKMIRWPLTSPDGKDLVFVAAGHLYKMELPNGTPKRVTNSSELEFSPSFSADGKWLTYVTWNDDEGGNIWRLKLNGGSPEKLTKTANQYANPAFSPDGSKIAFLQGSGVANRGDDLGGENFLQIHLLDLTNGKTNYVISTANRGPNRRMPRLSFDSKGERVIFFESKDGQTMLSSAKLDGTDYRQHIANKNAEEIVLSPDGKWVAFKELHNAYVAPLPVAGAKALTVSANDTNVPVKKLTKIAGEWLNWSSDSKTVTWSFGTNFYRQTLEKIYSEPKENKTDVGKDTSKEEKDKLGQNLALEAESFPISLVLPRYSPKGTVVLTNARIITMNGDQVIENGSIVIEDNRIKALGGAKEITLPSGAKVVDMAGKTIMPGIIDVHAHMHYSNLDITPSKDWAYYTNLAYGVTTTHDPSASTHAVFSQSELVETGQMVGPRIYSTGFILYGAENPEKAVVESLDDARNHVRRLKAFGAFSVKSYNQPRREQRQWIIQAAREEAMMVVPEGGSTYAHNMTMILDGHTGIEHAIPVAPLYKDAIELFSRSQTGYTPTLIVGYGGIWGENYFYQHYNVWENTRLLKFTPRENIDARSRRRMLVPEDDFGHFDLAKTVKKVLDAGGHIQLGAHGQLQGLGAHWEMWMFSQGGMTPLQTIRAATLDGAKYLGLDGEIGSLTVGKLADLVVLDKNPLTDIRNTDSVSYVMKNGELFEADNMDKVWPIKEPRKPFRWQR